MNFVILTLLNCFFPAVGAIFCFFLYLLFFYVNIKKIIETIKSSPEKDTSKHRLGVFGLFLFNFLFSFIFFSLFIPLEYPDYDARRIFTLRNPFPNERDIELKRALDRLQRRENSNEHIPDYIVSDNLMREILLKKEKNVKDCFDFFEFFTGG